MENAFDKLIMKAMLSVSFGCSCVGSWFVQWVDSNAMETKPMFTLIDGRDGAGFSASSDDGGPKAETGVGELDFQVCLE